MPTNRIRLTPDFIIVGAQRAGTTSLYKYLIKHPYIVPAIDKEIHFFDKRFYKGLAWYRANFALLPYKNLIEKVHNHHLITGEASPYYMFHPLVPGRIVRTLPGVKLIVILRNPIDRAYSHYWHEVRLGYETLSFQQAIEKETQRLLNQQQKLISNDPYCSVPYQHFSYLARGIYIDQLKVWYNFFPREQFLILNSQDFYTNPTITLSCVAEFLGLPHWELSEYRRYNCASYPPMKPEMQLKLAAYFYPHNERLEEFLGMNFDWN